MSGWSKEKRIAVERAFYQFLDQCFIASKDISGDVICLGQSLYDGQKQLVTDIFDGLEEDIHEFYILKSRQLGICYDPSMRVLSAALEWISIADLKIGQEIVTVDENVPGGKGAGRKMRTGRVEALKEVFHEAFEVEMTNGVRLVATAEHRHLCRVRGAVHTEWRAVGKLKIGDSIRQITEPWGEATYEDGWYGGLLDGEGSISLPARSGAAVTMAQVDGPVLRRAKQYLDSRGLSYREEIDTRQPGETSKFGKTPVHKLLSTKMSDLFRLCGLTRPTRFIAKRWWEDKDLPGKKSGYGWREVVSITPLGKRRMIDVQTTHKTFICEGFVSHNSTITRALTTFFLGVFPGLKGALVFDTREHMGEARNDLVAMLEALPISLQFPSIKQDNREGLTLATNSKMLFMAAGVSKRKSSKGLGASYGLSLAHCSEMAAWENEEGLESFKNSLSDKNPDRLYIWESTARGYTQWFEMWNTARGDTMHCKCIFLGWWAKDSQRIERTDKDWALYGDNISPSKEEARKIKLVKELYGHEITVEQLAWVRRKYDPAARQEGDAQPEFTASASRVQEQPWTESESFQQTGSVFFSAEKLKDQSDKYVNHKFHTYMFSTGIEFSDMRVFKAENSKSMELKVWEEPVQEAVYVFGIDPAFGENERNDRSAIQILRCYADGCDQVAEYAFPLINTMQFGWVIAALMGWYSSKPLSEVRYVLELNGPGSAVYNELRSLKAKLEAGYPALQEQGVRNVFQNVRTYIYSRPDSMGSGANYHIKTTQPIKVMLMERLRDFVSNGQVRIRSDALIKEMSTIARDGDSIQAPGALKDDRVLSLAFAIHCWEEKARRSLVQQRRTRQAEEARRNVTTIDQVRMYNANMMETFFNQKNKARAMERQFAMRQAWRRR